MKLKNDFKRIKFKRLAKGCLLGVLSAKLKKRPHPPPIPLPSPPIQKRDEQYPLDDQKHNDSLKDIFESIVNSNSDDLSELIRTLDIEESMKRLSSVSQDQSYENDQDLINDLEEMVEENRTVEEFDILEGVEDEKRRARLSELHGVSEPLPSLDQIDLTEPLSVPKLDMDSIEKHASVKLTGRQSFVSERLTIKGPSKRVKPVDVKKKRVYSSDEEEEIVDTLPDDVKDDLVSLKMFSGVNGILSTMTTSYRRKRNSLVNIGRQLKRRLSFDSEQNIPDDEEAFPGVSRQTSLPNSLAHPMTTLLPRPPPLHLPTVKSQITMTPRAEFPISPSLPNLYVSDDDGEDRYHETNESVKKIYRDIEKQRVADQEQDEKLKNDLAKLLQDTPRIRGLRPDATPIDRQRYTKREIEEESRAVTRLRKMVLRLEAETSKKGVNFTDYHHYIKPLDLVFFRGGDLVSDLVRFIQARTVKTKSSDADIRIPPSAFSHIGLVVTRDILEDDRLEPGKFYIWESTMSGSLGDGVKDIDGNTFLGVQIREFESVAKAYDGDKGSCIAISHLREEFKENVWESFPPRILKERFTALFKKYNGIRYDVNLISLGSSFIPAIRPIRKIAEKPTKDWLFCSELVACVYRDLGLLSENINPKNTVPMDFLGFDNEIKKEQIPVIVEKPVVIAVQDI